VLIAKGYICIQTERLDTPDSGQIHRNQQDTNSVSDPKSDQDAGKPSELGGELRMQPSGKGCHRRNRK